MNKNIIKCFEAEIKMNNEFYSVIYNIAVEWFNKTDYGIDFLKYIIVEQMHKNKPSIAILGLYTTKENQSIYENKILIDNEFLNSFIGKVITYYSPITKEIKNYTFCKKQPSLKFKPIEYNLRTDIDYTVVDPESKSYLHSVTESMISEKMLRTNLGMILGTTYQCISFKRYKEKANLLLSIYFQENADSTTNKTMLTPIDKLEL